MVSYQSKKTHSEQQLLQGVILNSLVYKKLNLWKDEKDEVSKKIKKKFFEALIGLQLRM